jgi:hypothetical protein
LPTAAYSHSLWAVARNLEKRSAAVLFGGGEILVAFWYSDDTDGGIRLARIRLESRPEEIA